ncbi:non-ribosomal peptide synthetase [Aquimarina longa]|uniref:non-ribosomal peptide synthetase n=1 Tax=Aquimarina longa TaxID=1080221 RepID=UPI00130DFAAE|nr:non-ribosomal peptide synthetase [Aquimarina longa]
MEVEILIREIFMYPTVSQLGVHMLEATKGNVLPEIISYQKTDKVPLSFSQERLWFIDQLEGSLGYHIPILLQLKGNIDKEVLENSFRTIISRHEILRTVITSDDGIGYQYSIPADEWKMDEISIKKAEEISEKLEEYIAQPFDLSEDYMFRMCLFSLGEQEYILAGVFHHIASDGWSDGIFVNEFVYLYNTLKQQQQPTLLPLSIQYADYAIWQREHIQGEVLEKELSYWKEKLTGATPLLLPTDYVRPSVQSSNGTSISFSLDKGIQEGVYKICKQEKVTTFMMLLASFNVLLYKYSGQKDICVGTPIANRTQKEAEGLIGFFVNTLVLRNSLEENISFLNFLQQVKKTTLEAYGNQSAPFEKVVDHVIETRDMSISPLFQVLFVFQNKLAHQGDMTLDGLTLSPYNYERKISSFDITISISESDSGFEIDIEYCTDIFKEETIINLSKHYEELLKGIIKDSDTKINALGILTKDDKQTLLYDFNPKAFTLPEKKTVLDLFQEQVTLVPNAIAVVFEETTVTYSELDKITDDLALCLQQKGISKNDFVGICIDRSLEMIIGILGVLKSGGAYVPISPDYPSERIDYMLQDTQIRIILSNSNCIDSLINQKSIDFILLDKNETYANDIVTQRDINTIEATDTAYVIYTSGSTGTPKGVLVSHQNLLALAHSRLSYYGTIESMVLLPSFVFDPSVSVIIGTLLTGGRLIIPTESSISDPSAIKNLLNTKIDLILCVPTYYEFLVDEGILDATEFRGVILGGEALSKSIVSKHFDTYSDIPIYNEYGPTECTVWSTVSKITNPDQVITIGSPINTAQIYIIDSYYNLVPKGVIGEICIGGLGVSKGYLNREDLTQAVFVPNPFVKGEQIYHTGDLAKWLPDGTIEFIGRKDDQVKIRGYRVELGEIESILLENEEVRSCCVLASKDNLGTNRLIGYVVTNGEFKKHTIQEFLKTRLPEYMIPQLWVSLDSMPLTSNGKIDKSVLPDPEMTQLSKVEYVAPKSETEKQLVTIWQDLLEVEQIGIQDNFFDMGGHSLLATRLVSRIRKEMEIEITVKNVFTYPKISELSVHIEKQAKGVLLPEIVPQERTEKIPLSYSQERLWFIDELEGSTAYHLPVVMKLEGKLDIQILENSFKLVVDRHEVLRTIIYKEDGVGYQKIIPSDDWSIEIVRLENPEDLESHVNTYLIAPFDLSKDYMFRMRLYDLGNNSYVIAGVFHHISSDGWSNNILIKEFTHLYYALSTTSTIELPPLSIQYADYALWQRKYVSGDVLDRQLEYWSNQLRGTSPLYLPIDYTRPSIQSNEGTNIGFTLDEELSDALKAMSKREDVTIFMLLLTAFKVLLYRYSGQEDICVGTPVANRTQGEIEDVIGFFVNTLALRSDLSQSPTFTALLHQVKEVTLGAYDHQQVPFEKIVDKVVTTRDRSISPLFQVMFTVQDSLETEETTASIIEGLKLSSYNFKEDTAQFEITLTAMTSSKEIFFNIEYCTALFKENTIQKMFIHFEELLRSIVKDSKTSIGSLSMLPTKEKDQLKDIFNETKVVYPSERTIIDLFKNQVLQSPLATALVFEGKSISYEELDKRSTSLASYLHKIAGTKQQFIGISMERSTEMIVGILSILKSGKAYVPIDATYPKERIDYILRDADISVVVTSSANAHKYTTEENEHIVSILLDEKWEEVSEKSTEIITEVVSPNDIAYVIYTSGTTGQPKGVLISHHSLYDYALTFSSYFNLQSDDKILQQASISFDVSVEEIFPILISGGALHLATSAKDFDALLQVCEQEEITLLSTSPYFVQYLNTVKDNFKLKLRTLISGGDVLKPEYVTNLYSEIPVYNTYGPTESTVCATYHSITDIESSTIPIGKPITNRVIYIVNQSLELQPTGVSGEILIGGSGIAQGYLNKEELTKERFIESPFREGEIVYRTGDLGRWNSEGAIEFIGRKDNQVNIRGYRIELGEIEAALSNMPLVENCCVLCKEDINSTTQLVGYIASQEEIDKQQVIEFLRDKLPEYMIPKLWIMLDEIPLTTNGKIDKKALPDIELSKLSTVTYQAPRNEIEEHLAIVWQELLGVEQVGIHDNFFDLGGDSIITIQVVSRLKRYGYHLQPKDLFEYQTLSGLSKVVEKKIDQIKGEQGVLEGDCALSPIQQWYFEEGYATDSHFNQSIFVAVSKTIEQEYLEQATIALIAYHDALRFSYHQEEDIWIQKYKNHTGELEIVDLQNVDGDISDLITETCTSYQEGLELSTGEIFKVVLIKTPDTEEMNRLFIVAHHLVVDGVSWRIILDDFNTILETLEKEEKINLGVKGSSFREWVTEFRTYATHTSVLKQLPYWKSISDDYIPLPMDNEDKDSKFKDLIEYSIRLDKEYTSLLLKEVYHAYGTEIDDILLCCLALTLTEWTHSDKLVIGMESHGREHISKTIDNSRTVGWFTNLYPVSLSVTSKISLGELIKSIKEQLRRIPDKGIGYSALRYMHPSQDIREQLSNTSWDVVFNYLGQLDNTVQKSDWLDAALESPGSEIGDMTPVPESLAINSSVAGGELTMGWSFSEEKFSQDTIEKLAKTYLENLKKIITHCTDQEKRELTPSDYGLEKEIDYHDFNTYAATLEQITHQGKTTLTPLYKLSPLQEGMLFHGVFTENSNAYIEQLVINFSKTIDVEVMKASWDYVLQNHSILRSAFIYGEFSIPLQRVYQKVTLPFEELDYTQYSISKQEELFADFLEKDKNTPFVFDKPPLMRVTMIKTSANTFKMIFTNHHILMDGWSFSIIMGEIMNAYEAITKGEQLPVVEEDLFEDYIKYIGGKDIYEEEKFWKHYLEKLDTPTLLPFIAPTPLRNTETSEQGKETLIIDQALTERLKDYAQKHRLTVNTLVQGVWALLLSRYTNTEDVVFGATVSGRSTDMEDSERKVGLYINTLPLCANIDKDKSIVEQLLELQSGHTACREHQYTSLSTIQSYSTIKGDLFDSIVVFENYPISDTLFEEESLLEIKTIEAKEQTNYLFTITASLGKELEIDFQYVKDLLSEYYIEMITSHFEVVLHQLITLPEESKIKDISIFSKKEHDLLTTGFNTTTVDYPLKTTILSVFNDQVIHTPHAIATVFEDVTMTYAELDTRSNQLAAYLIEQGVKTGDLVGICLDRSLEMIIGIMGILKSGSAYVPIDPESPKDRIHYIIEDSAISVFVTDQKQSLSIGDKDDITFICIDKDWEIIETRISKTLLIPSPEDIAYVIYTSGTTGQPKGVLISHHSLYDYALTFSSYFNLQSDDKILQQASISFDVSVEEIFPILISGGVLYLAKSAKDFDALLQICEQEEITLLSTSPYFVQYLNTVKDDFKLKLRTLISGGDVLKPEYVTNLYSEIPIYNTYGPTESTVCATYHSITDIESSTIPIGKPITNRVIYIVNQSLELQPTGVSGEILIGGSGIAQGYLNKAELTKERFIESPFREGEIVYRTGDLGRWNPEGTIEFIGRKDDQINIRGYRIELGEIEAVLSSMPLVENCCVLCKEDINSTTQLVGYIASSEDIDKHSVRVFLREKLPEYMVPQLWVMLDEMPLNINGKIDKKALPEVDLSALSTETYVAPTNDVEQKVVTIWQELLGIEQIGIHDNFFDLGGHSILAMKLMVIINKEFSKAMNISYLFQYPTIALFSEQIVSGDGTENKILIEFNTQGSKRPIFCVHPLGGTVMIYKDLSESLGSQQPFYAFQSSGMDGESPILRTVEEMAVLYIKEMQKIDEIGPYTLAGYSFGGNIAVEMALQLRNKGFEVVELLIFDTPPPTEETEEMTTLEFKEFLSHMIKGINTEYDTDIATDSSQFENKSKEEQLEVLYSLIRTSEIAITESQMKGVIGVVMANEECRYTAEIDQKLDAKVILFKANDGSDAEEIKKQESTAYGWQELTTQPVIIKHLTEDHETILRPPFVKEVTDYLTSREVISSNELVK